MKDRLEFSLFPSYIASGQWDAKCSTIFSTRHSAQSLCQISFIKFHGYWPGSSQMSLPVYPGTLATPSQYIFSIIGQQHCCRIITDEFWPRSLCHVQRPVILLVICNRGHLTHFKEESQLLKPVQLFQTDKNFWWNDFLFSACLLPITNDRAQSG